MSTLENDWQSYTRFVGVCGAVAACEGMITYPFDLVKTRQQFVTPNSAGDMHTNTLRYLRQVVNTDGLRSLYRGFGWSVIGGLPSEISFYFVYTVVKDGMLQTKFGKENPSAVFLGAGAISDTISLLLWVPADLISQRLQVQGVAAAYEESAMRRGAGRLPATHALPLTGWQMVGNLVRTEGIPGMWRGLGATIAVHTPASALWWLAYENYKVAFGDLLGKKGEDSVIVQSCAGALAGATAASLTTPLDLLKTRTQCSPISKPIYGHFLDVIREGGGMTSLFRGFLPRVIASAPRSVISLVGYEFALKFARCEHWDQT